MHFRKQMNAGNVTGFVLSLFHLFFIAKGIMSFIITIHKSSLPIYSLAGLEQSYLAYFHSFSEQNCEGHKLPSDVRNGINSLLSCPVFFFFQPS